jgi:hypothetical protein
MTTNIIVDETRDSSTDTTAIIADDSTNAVSICCSRCGSIVVRANMAHYCSTRWFDLPVMDIVRSAVMSDAVDKERIDRWWIVEDMFTFENVGYTHAVDGVKYLTCADCEMGPIGFVDAETKHNYVALSRVVHQ